MMKNIKFLNSLIGTRNFGVSALSASWRDRIRPITFGEEEPTDEEKYFQNFKSRKGPSADMIRYMPPTMPFKDVLTPAGLTLSLKHWRFRKELYNQRYIDERVNILGPDLAAAHFIIARGGKVRFKGKGTWEIMNDEDEYDLPRTYDPDYLVEEMDISQMPLMYDGLENLEDLNFLKTFSARECPRFDDWCMDRICTQFAETLEILDISKSRLVTGKGIETVVKLRNLKHLKVNGLENLDNMKLICLLLQESNPQLHIEGITY